MQHLRQLVPAIDHIEVCYDAGGAVSPSLRRKPAPGMLFDAASVLGLDLDPQLDGGRPLARCRLRSLRPDAAPSSLTLATMKSSAARPDFIVSSFPAAVGTILAHHPAEPAFNRFIYPHEIAQRPQDPNLCRRRR